MTHIHIQPWALYNEIDEHAADWLENLIARGVIAPGVVDRRSIEDICPSDLRGFRQVHFFAGIGVWSYAFRRAGVSDDTALWTGSCPCQPFSSAGKGGGVDDERHLWPALYHLIRECRPKRFFGEQVASKDGLGWLDLVLADMEEAGYAIGAVDTCSAGSGAPHIRQRLRIAAYDLGPAAGWVQYASGDRRHKRRAEPSGRGASSRRITGGMGNHHHQGLEGFGERYQAEIRRLGALGSVAATSESSRLADSDFINDDRTGPGSSVECREIQDQKTILGKLDPNWMADSDGDEQWEGGDARGAASEGLWPELGGCDESDWLGDSDSTGSLPGAQRGVHRREEGPWPWDGQFERSGAACRPRPTNGFWRDADWLFCRDGKWRPVEPSSFPLVDGSAFRVGSGSAFEGKSRVGMLKGYGNAVDAEATTDFIEAFFEKDTIDLKSNGPADEPSFVRVKSTDCGLFEDLLG